jgi:hypothetical protein
MIYCVCVERERGGGGGGRDRARVIESERMVWNTDGVRGGQISNGLMRDVI